MEDDFEIVCGKIEEEKDSLNAVSQEIWSKPELAFNEIQAHAFLSDTFEHYGFNVERHYLLETAFRAEYSSKMDPERNPGPTVAILVEYDALPEIGHACGHNLISEAGLAAAIGVKEIMDRNPTLPGKLVVMGTPAEEDGGGKIKLIEKGAFKDIDVALMVHPAFISLACPSFLCNLRGSIEYVVKESHTAYAPQERMNALDAAVMCYNNISLLRQQIKPDHRIHVILTEGGVTTNVIPAETRMELTIRAPNVTQVKNLRTRIEMCINGAATATGCKVNCQFHEADSYQNQITNKVLIDVYKEYFLKLGMTFNDESFAMNVASSDMGNVSHVVPAYHPIFPIPSRGGVHMKEFTEAAGLPTAQKPTLAAAKAMAMTAVSVLRNPDTLNKAKSQFDADIVNELNDE